MERKKGQMNIVDCVDCVDCNQSMDNWTKFKSIGLTPYLTRVCVSLSISQKGNDSNEMKWRT